MAAVVSSLAIASRHRSAKESSHHQLSCKQNLRSEAVLRLHNTQIKVVEFSKAFCDYHIFENVFLGKIVMIFNPGNIDFYKSDSLNSRINFVDFTNYNISVRMG